MLTVYSFLAVIKAQETVKEFVIWTETRLSLHSHPSTVAAHEGPCGSNVMTFEPGKKCHSKVMHQREWYILMAVMRGNRVGGNWLMKWDELKNSHGTLIDWCTGREWPLNCMTVISAWWRLNIQFQRSSERRTII